MIQSFEIANVGPIKQVSGSLSMLHAFIGPNDSGKSSILRALQATAAWFRGDDLRGFPPPIWPPPPLRAESTVALGFGEGIDVTLQADGPYGAENGPESVIARSLRGGRLLRLDPDAVSAPSSLIPDGSPLTFQNERGAGLAGICDALLNRADGSFEQLSRTVSQHFPTIKALRLGTPSPATKTLEAVLQDGTRVPASQMSEGFLYFVAIAVLPLIDAGALLFLEEPENGLHPARIAEVMKVLRTLSERGTQILMATHSPLVVNELRPDEVTVVTRDEEMGTQLMPIAATPNFAERSKVFALGELWLNYANGIDEAPLLKGIES